MQKLSTICVALLLILFPVVFPASATAQNPFTRSSSSDGRIPITIVLDENVDAPTILRRASASPANVILTNSESLTPQALSNAIFSLLLLEARDPDGHQRQDNAAQRIILSSPWPVFSWAAQALGLLHSAQVRHVPALGTRKTVQVWVPPLTGEFRPGRTP